MSEFLAILGDTWRQSKSQVVFLLMVLVLFAMAVFLVVAVSETHVVRVTLPPKPSADSSDAAGDPDTDPRVSRIQDAARELPGFRSVDDPPSPGFGRRRREAVAVLVFDDPGRAAAAAEALSRDPNLGLEDAEVETRDHFAWVWSDEPIYFLEQQWRESYIQAEKIQENRFDFDSTAADLDRREALERELEEKSSLTHAHRSIESLLSMAFGLVFSVAMLLFIGACAGYFPGLLAEGAVDVMLAKPVSRLQIYLGKYLGGLLLFAAALTAFHLIVYLGLGVRAGLWHHRIFVSLPLAIFAAAVMYAMLALIGTVTRSATLCVIVGFIYYLVVDTLLQLLSLAKFVPDAPEWLQTAGEVVYYGIPNFGLMKGLYTSLVLTTPFVDWAPIGTAAAWMVVSLGLGFLSFRRRDF